MRRPAPDFAWWTEAFCAGRILGSSPDFVRDGCWLKCIVQPGGDGGRQHCPAGDVLRAVQQICNLKIGVVISPPRAQRSATVGFMAVLVANGAQIKCSMGTLPSVLTVTATPPHVAAAPVPAVMLGAITDFVPVANIKSFGMCSAPTNPAVIAAQGSAPCVPATTSHGAAADGGGHRNCHVRPNGHLSVHMAGHHHRGEPRADARGHCCPDSVWLAHGRLSRLHPEF